MTERPDGVHLTNLAITLLALIRETVEALVPFDAVMLTVRRPSLGGEEDTFGSDGCIITLRSAHNSQTTTELKILLADAGVWGQGDWIDVVLNDGGLEIFNDGRVDESGQPLVLDELRLLVRAVLTGRTHEHSETGADFSPYPHSGN